MSRQSSHRGFRIALSIAAALAGAGLPACVGSGAETTGTISVNLVGQAPSGTVYRLRDATIVVHGPTSTRYFDTEDDPDRTTLAADVVIGDYSASLQPGWRIERVEGLSTTTVPAELKSGNPLAFTVLEAQRTTVPLQFRVFGEDIDMSQGYEIVLDIEECELQAEVCGDGMDNNCNGATDCSDTACTGHTTCPVCGDGIVQNGEGCDDGNLADLDGCSSECTPEPSEVEPNEDGTPSTGGSGVTGNDFATASADANGALAGPAILVAKISPVGDEDVFAFENLEDGLRNVRFDIWSPALGIGVPCGSSTDTAMVIRDAAGAALASNDDRNSSSDRCSALEISLAPGQRVYVHVIDYGDNAAIPGYVLQAVYSTPVCSNGVIELGEQCDDGNTTSGDGCSDTCQAELAAEAEPNDSFAEADASAVQLTGSALLHGSIAAAGDRDVYRLTLAAPAVIRFESFASPFDCSISTAVRLFDAVGAPVVADLIGAGIGQCGSLVFRLDAGVHYVQVEETNNDAALASYVLDVRVQEDRGAEAEAPGAQGENDTIAMASTELVGGGRDMVVFGDHSLETDVDIYAISVPPLARIRAEIIEGDRSVETCESNGIDSSLTLLDPSGATLATDGDSGRGFCSSIDGTGALPRNASARNTSLSPRTMYLRVQATGTVAQRQFQYRLQVTLR